MSIQIIKADGERETFKEAKLRRSLKNAGASAEEVREIVTKVIAQLTEGMTTQEIYRMAFAFLREIETPSAARYSLRRALFNLGPTGFPFEDFLARMYETEGYKTKKRIIIHGKCVEHELDVAAYKPDHAFVAEAKFHARPGIKSDLQVALYSYARMMDLADKTICNDDICGIKEFWVITNTKFTTSAQKYAECAGLNLLSWDYPKKGNLHDKIRDSGLYPITVLTTLNASQKSALISRNVIVCKDLVERPQVLRHVHMSTKKTEAVLSEARQLCQ
jgi:hypothetical protein